MEEKLKSVRSEIKKCQDSTYFNLGILTGQGIEIGCFIIGYVIGTFIKHSRKKNK